MQVGMIGLGRMGANMVERLRRGEHDVIGYDAIQRFRKSIRSPRLWSGWNLHGRPGSWCPQAIPPSRRSGS